MLTIVVPEKEFWSEITERFVNTKEQTLHLEHSLAAISKWESKHHKPFFGEQEPTSEEMLDYIRCMVLDENVDPLVFYAITEENVNDIFEYIKDPMTATWFAEDKNPQKPKQPGKKKLGVKIVTAEIIYHWMINANVPFECQYWHFNRLMTLLRVIAEKNKPEKKMSKRELMARNTSLNAARKARLHTTG